MKWLIIRRKNQTSSEFEFKISFYNIYSFKSKVEKKIIVKKCIATSTTFFTIFLNLVLKNKKIKK